MKILKIMAFLLFALTVSFQSVVAGEASVGKLGILFHLKPHQDRPEWTWTPTIRFKMAGPLSSSSTVSVEYTLPNGKPFNTVQCENISAIAEDEFFVVNDCGYRQGDEKATNLTGTFGFRILLSDELAGTNKTLFSGKLNVGKQLYNPGKLPDRNKQFYYYVDNDWRLPIGYVSTWYGDTSNNIYCELWMKKPLIDVSKVTGFLFYNGKQVAEASGSFPLSATPPETPEWSYEMLQMKFPALTEKPDSVGFDREFKAYENPGEYEIKILRDGKLARTLKFSVGKEGKPVDGGTAKQNGVANHGALVPVSVLGEGDGLWNKAAWKTEAFWGNPLKGFTAP